MSETATATLDYLDCPECGTRYVARDQPPAPAEKKARWFHCHRCGKRVRSAELSWGELPAAVEYT